MTASSDKLTRAAALAALLLFTLGKDLAADFAAGAEAYDAGDIGTPRPRL